MNGLGQLYQLRTKTGISSMEQRMGHDRKLDDQSLWSHTRSSKTLFNPVQRKCISSLCDPLNECAAIKSHEQEPDTAPIENMLIIRSGPFVVLDSTLEDSPVSFLNTDLQSLLCTVNIYSYDTLRFQEKKQAKGIKMD